MWILTILPEFVTHILLTIGVLGCFIGFVLGFMPLISSYKLPIQLISMLILCGALYLEGAIAETASWNLKVKEMEAKVAQAEAKSAIVNTEIVTKVLTKKQIIREKGDSVIKFIDREVVKYDSTCQIPDVVIRAHNAAASDDPVSLISTHNDLVKK